MPTKRTTAKQAETKTTGMTPEAARGKAVVGASEVQSVAGERADQSDFLIGCTLDERAYCIRLIRLLRDNYWATQFVIHILDVEARNKHQLTIDGMKKILDNFDVLEALASNAQRLGSTWSNHPVMRAVRKEFGDQEMRDYKGERAIRNLIQSAHK